MNDIDRLYTEAAAALDAIVKYRATKQDQNAKLERIGAVTFKQLYPSDDANWQLYKALTAALPEEEGLATTFAILSEEMGIDEEGYPITEDDYRMSDVEFDYRAAIGWPQGFRA